MVGIKVTRQEPVLVVPSKPTKFEWKELSDLDDQQGLYFQVPVIMSFKGNNETTNKDPAKVIKKALAEALVYYYPFAGRLREGQNRKLIVDCNDEGVLFIEADAEVTLEEIENDILPPCPLMEELLFDVPGSSGILGCPLLLFQLTRLMCGGFILGVRYNHTMCDMLGFVQMLNAMIELSRGAEAPSILPIWKRDLLTARNPPQVTCTHYELQEVSKYEQVMSDEEMVHVSLLFGAKEMKAMRDQIPPNIPYTTFELLCACLWRCRTVALQPDPEEIVRLSFVFNVRGKDIMSLPQGYYGNTFVYPAVTTKAEDLISGKLAYALELVKEARGKVNNEYVQSFVDQLVINGRRKYSESWLWIVSNTMRTGLETMDFGWGTPLYCGTPRETAPVISNFTRFKNGKGEDVVAVLLSLPKQAVAKFHNELAKVIGEPVEGLVNVIV